MDQHWAEKTAALLVVPKVPLKAAYLVDVMVVTTVKRMVVRKDALMAVQKGD